MKVSGCNTRLIKGEDGSKHRIEKKIHYSNVNLLDPISQAPTRVSLKFLDDGGVLRISKLSGEVLHWPEKSSGSYGDMQKEDLVSEGAKDTSAEVALRRTYDYKADVEAVKLARLGMSKYNHEIGK